MVRFGESFLRFRRMTNISENDRIKKKGDHRVLYVLFFRIRLFFRNPASMDMKKRQRIAHAFTLIEILVVVVIIGLLASVLLVSMNQSWLRSKDSSFKSTATSVQRALMTCCASPGTILTASYGGEMCVGGERYPATDDMDFVSVSGCHLDGSFTVVLEPGSENRGNCVWAILNQEDVAFDGC